jgi:hypothetical protein
MSKENTYSLYMLERFKAYKNLSGKDAYIFFKDNKIFEALKEYFEYFHTIDYRQVFKELSI